MSFSLVRAYGENELTPLEEMTIALHKANVKLGLWIGFGIFGFLILIFVLSVWKKNEMVDSRSENICIAARYKTDEIDKVVKMAQEYLYSCP